MFQNCILSLFSSILSNIFSDILFAVLVVWLFQRSRYWFYLKRRYHKKVFNTFWKSIPNEVVHTIKCTVKGNRVRFSGKRNNNDDLFEGEFIMNPINLKIGEGYHAHKDSDGFAFLKVIIKDEKTFLVEAPYTAVRQNEKQAKTGFRVYQALIWRKRSEKL